MATKLVRPEEGWPIQRAAAAVCGGAADQQLAALATWLDLLAGWNARVDLTAARSPNELVDLMVADALILAGRLPPDAHVIDVGTGAGAPGLALSVLRPDLHMTLVEPLAKRAAFLRTVLGTLGNTALPHVTLDVRRGAEVATAHHGGWDVALARATLPPAPWLALAADLVPAGGTAWVFLAKEPKPLCESFAFAEEVPYSWPLTGAKRRVVRYERVGGLRPGG